MYGYPNVLPAGNSYQIPINMGRLTAAFSGAFWAMRNGTVNRIRVRTIALTLTFDGVGSADSNLIGVYRFSGAAYTGGTSLTPVKKDSTMIPSTIADARQIASAALGSAGVSKESIPLIATSNQRDKAATTTERHVLDFSGAIILNAGEGLVIVNDIVSVIGDGITGYIEFDEV